LQKKKLINEGKTNQNEKKIKDRSSILFQSARAKNDKMTIDRYVTHDSFANTLIYFQLEK